PLAHTLFPYTTLFRSVRHGTAQLVASGRSKLVNPIVSRARRAKGSQSNAPTTFAEATVNTVLWIVQVLWGGLQRHRFRQSLMLRSEEHTSELQSLRHL